eukprot:TRINITY_DN2308_c0_g1_i1.p1 TRINITY_DN2308_c0_g1~~TRINITY_DN2308_c0_g1_i1.p1  ORF type:complete len:277 (+),score=23.85 TRINITY_DN2308_c0_g1_i1:39-833(+)
MPDVGDTNIYEQLAIPIPTAKLIGDSSLCKVYRNIYKNRDVAIKIVDQQILQQMSMIQRDDLMIELEFAWRLSHPNILQIDQFQMENGQLVIVMQLMQYDLHYYIHDMHKQKDIQLYDIVRIIKCIASALDYLHRLNPFKRVWHGNLHPRNVLIAFDGTIKVSDYTLKKITRYNVSDQELLYFAPEMMDGEENFISSDMYSLGVIGWEIWMRKTPVQNQNFVLDDAPFFYKQMILNCVQINLDKRPSAARVLDICNQYQRDLQM